MSLVGKVQSDMVGSPVSDEEMGSLRPMLPAGKDSLDAVHQKLVGIAGSPAVRILPMSYSLRVGAPSPKIAVLVGEDQKQRKQFRSKSVAWKEPMLLLQKIGSRRLSPGKGSRSFRQQPKTSTQQFGQDFHRPSRWARFWRKLRFDGGKKVHAARPEWLNYDAQSYAMNFESGSEAPRFSNAVEMPRISGPGAREIVTIILTRSSSMNRNSGCILIPKPVLGMKQETTTPLWKRRRVQAPSLLQVRMRSLSMRRQSTGA